MIIGFDASRAFLNKKTGTENYSFQILSHLAKIDRKNAYYVYLRPGVQNIRISENQKIEEDSGFPVFRFSDFPNNFHFITIPYPRLWTQAGLALQTFKDSLDVLFVPAHTLPLVRKPGLKTIITVHDLGAEYLPQAHQLKQRLYLKFMTDYQLKSASKIIAVSDATKQDLIKKVGISEKNIKVVYEGINPLLSGSINQTYLDNTLTKFDLKNQNYFLFVGSIQPRKNLERLITSYFLFLKSIASSDNRVKGLVARSQHLGLKEKLKEPLILATDPLPLLVLAGGKGWLSEEIYELPEKLGIKEYVKFLGYVPDSDLPALYKGSLGFLFPSLFEGFGLPVLEAMACNCPVLTSNISSLPEVAGKAALLVDPYDEKEIAQNILRLYQDKKLRSELIKKGITQIKKFSWEKAAKETLEVLESK